MAHSSDPFTREVRLCRNGDRTIYGLSFLPPGEGRRPLVIFSHELGSTLRSGIPYAKRLAAAGYASYAFDFCGGGAFGNRSDGATTEMTVSSEIGDLEAVIDTARTWDFIDPEKIILIGASQGGVVSALTACRRPGLAAGLVLLYPAFSAVDHMHMLFASPQDIPEEFELFNGLIRLGRQYALELWDADFYGELSRYPDPVLLLHGDSDGTVPLRFSERVCAALPDCEFHVIPGGEHGFYGRPLDDAMAYILTYLERRLG